MYMYQQTASDKPIKPSEMMKTSAKSLLILLNNENNQILMYAVFFRKKT